jgi:hypothetical protein
VRRSSPEAREKWTGPSAVVHRAQAAESALLVASDLVADPDAADPFFVDSDVDSDFEDDADAGVDDVSDDEEPLRESVR